ncbi:MAG: hypothetical protein IPO07_30760 [Haliscomenobacter sp.]|nr:hypothetical protein [Haliscomenobacter sp.]MBK9492666.1 hypothetical protein [Haliscomenobacter sp.]
MSVTTSKSWTGRQNPGSRERFENVIPSSESGLLEVNPPYDERMELEDGQAFTRAWATLSRRTGHRPFGLDHQFNLGEAVKIGRLAAFTAHSVVQWKTGVSAFAL